MQGTLVELLSKFKGRKRTDLCVLKLVKTYVAALRAGRKAGNFS
jgi:hypothetical protein